MTGFKTTFMLTGASLDWVPGFSNVSQVTRNFVDAFRRKRVGFVFREWQNLGSFGRRFDESLYLLLGKNLFIRSETPRKYARKKVVM